MKPNLSQKSSLVIFSGGQDSTVCLHWAMKNFRNVKAVFFEYGQRHKIEQKSAEKICELNNIELKIFKLNFFSDLGGNSLTDNNLKIKVKEGELPNTFVPGRNLIFLTYGAGFAFHSGIRDLITGVCETDFSGYPDCRQNTMDSLAKTLSLGMDTNFSIHTPLMHLDKQQVVNLAKELNALKSLSFSHTCYEGQYPPCGKCPSCLLRIKGFEKAGIPDPLLERASSA